MKGPLSLLVPSVAWTRDLSPTLIRSEVIAGLIAAIVMIPQLAPLATLAGLPPEYGVYASIIPVIVAALWGSCWQSLSGPNTAVSIMTMAAVLPWGNVGTAEYIRYALTLTFFVGMFQVLLSFARIGDFLNVISHSVVAGITNAVGVLIVVTAAWSFIGVLNTWGDPFEVKLWHLAHDLARANPFALAVGVATVAAGALARTAAGTRRYALAIALGAGTVAAVLIDLAVGNANTRIEYLGHVHIEALRFTVPHLAIPAVVILQQLLFSGFAIALLGIMQSVVIARGLAEKSGQHINPNREAMAQGLANVAASFTSGMAGSASFNRSQAHLASGAKTPLSGVMSALFMLALLLLAAPLLTFIPTAAMAGVLMLVGWGLIEVRESYALRKVRSEAFIFGLVFLTALFSGLVVAVFAGMLLSAAIYIAHVARPAIFREVEHADHRVEVKITGNLFFGSADALSEEIAHVAEHHGRHGRLVVDITQVVYVDATATRILRNEAARRESEGGKLVVRVTAAQHTGFREAIHCLLEAFDTAPGGAEKHVELEYQAA